MISLKFFINGLINSKQLISHVLYLNVQVKVYVNLRYCGLHLNNLNRNV